MEPHLLAAIISKLIMCRNKLQDYNFTVNNYYYILCV